MRLQMIGQRIQRPIDQRVVTLDAGFRPERPQPFGPIPVACEKPMHIGTGYPPIDGPGAVRPSIGETVERVSPYRSPRSPHVNLVAGEPDADRVRSSRDVPDRLGIGQYGVDFQEPQPFDRFGRSFQPVRVEIVRPSI